MWLTNFTVIFDSLKNYYYIFKTKQDPTINGNILPLGSVNLTWSLQGYGGGYTSKQGFLIMDLEGKGL